VDLLDKFLPRKDFESYEDFYSNFKVNIPDNFNFAWDVMDVLAEEKGGERAMLWCDEAGAEAEFSYADIKRLSDQAAAVLTAGGIRKGDPVMLILKRRFEYWPILLALHKIGAIAIPATHLLTTKDLVYRCDAADIVGIICVDDPELMCRVDEAELKLERDSDSAGDSALRYKAFVRSVHTPARENPVEKALRLFEKQYGSQPRYSEKRSAGALVPWADFNALREDAPENFARPPRVNANSDIMLLYFTSGTTGMPRWSATISPIHWGTSLQPVTGTMWSPAAFTLPWPTQAGPRPPGARSTASGSAGPLSSSTTTTALSPGPCWK
jgi:acetyl-CoA synthetase